MPIDWEALWKELASSDRMAGAGDQAQMVARWRRVAQQLDKGERREPEPLLEFILGRLAPEMTVLDIGAGIGRWSLPIARHVRRVTAVEPLAEMRQILLERAAARQIGNLDVVAAPWMEADLPPHDVVIAAHATYSTADLAGFVRKMAASALRTWYLALRVPAHDGVIGELSQRIRGCWHDSPNFAVGYNLLLVAGFYPNVLMESRPARSWGDPTLEAALERAKRQLGLRGTHHDELVREVLSRRLTCEGGGYRWPDGMRSALVWADVG